MSKYQRVFLGNMFIYSVIYDMIPIGYLKLYKSDQTDIMI